MKKIILIIIMSISLTNCETLDEDCGCGFVKSYSEFDQSIEISNACSGNVKRWYLSEGDWKNANMGTTYCITNSTGW